MVGFDLARHAFPSAFLMRQVSLRVSSVLQQCRVYLKVLRSCLQAGKAYAPFYEDVHHSALSNICLCCAEEVQVRLQEVDGRVAVALHAPAVMPRANHAASGAPPAPPQRAAVEDTRPPNPGYTPDAPACASIAASSEADSGSFLMIKANTYTMLS